jgi:hypothetical protein
MKLLSRDRTICGGLFAAQWVRNRRLSKPNTVVIRRAGYGALGRLDRVRGVRFLRLTCRAANGPAQPEMTHLRHWSGFCIAGETPLYASTVANRSSV